MAGKFRFKKPNMTLVWTEVVLLALWLYFGDRIMSVLTNIVGVDQNVNVSNATVTMRCTNASIFDDAYQIMGLGNDCANHVAGAAFTDTNAANGLIGIVALVMVVMVLSNFITYSARG